MWEEFATLTRQIDGSESFEFPPVHYAAGVPAGRGMGNVNLDVTVREKSTGYEETTTRLLTVARSPVNLHLVSENSVFKPSLPLSFLVVTETPDNKPVDKRVTVSLRYVDEDLEQIEVREQRVNTRNGTAVLTVEPPEISFTVTPVMAPGGRLLVYQVLPGGEVAADYVPFNVAAVYPHRVQAGFGKEQVRPGESVDINVETQGPAQVGLVAVDRSVFILAENRLNLRQVFNELERLYMQPQVELHDVRIHERITARGAMETFQDAGVVVMTNKDVPEGKEYRSHRNARKGWLGAWAQALGGSMVRKDGAVMESAQAAQAATAAPMPVSAPPPAGDGAQELAEVTRVRQFFPETWLWTDVTTNGEGLATLPVEAPDSITT